MTKALKIFQRTVTPFHHGADDTNLRMINGKSTDTILSVGDKWLIIIFLIKKNYFALSSATLE
jgi:hypothetical protein